MSAHDDSLGEAHWIDQICDEFERLWLQRGQPEIEPYLVGIIEPLRTKLLMQLIAVDIEYRELFGAGRTPSEYVARFPWMPLASVASLYGKSSDSHTNDERTSQRDAVRNFDTIAFSNEQPQGDLTHKKIRYFGDYELLEKVARGGMGTVFRARQISLNRMVAVKTINSGQFASQEEVRRFYSEAESAASLDHPNIVPVYEVGEFEGNHFFSLAFVDGESLADLLFQGPLKPQDAAKLLRTVASAVQFAHDQGVIHRDLKPSNILLERGGRPRVTDFGLAKRMTDQSGITISGDILGTPSFMPPEQAAGKINAVGFRSDVYSLGAVLYTCLSGRPPFQSASNFETLRQVIDSEPVPLRQLNSAIPLDLQTLTSKCLEKSPANRYESPKSLADDLDRFLNGEPIVARPIGSLERGMRWCNKNPSAVLNVLGLFLVLLASFAGWQYMRFRVREVAQHQNAVSLLKQLNIASETELPRIVQLVRAEPRAEKLLLSQFESSPIDSEARYRAGVCLLPTYPRVVKDVCQSWTKVSWDEWIWIQKQLAPHREEVREWVRGTDPGLWDHWDDAPFIRFAAIAANLSLDSVEPQESSLSRLDTERVLSILLFEIRQDPTQLSAAAQAFYPLRDRLGPGLAKRMHYTQVENGVDASAAAILSAELFSGEPPKLIANGWSARRELLPVLFGKPIDQRKMKQEMQTVLNVVAREGSWEESNGFDRRRAVAGATLFGLGEHGAVWLLLRHQSNPSVRSLLIDWIPSVERNPEFVLSKLKLLLQDRPRQVEQVLADREKNGLTPNPWLFDAETSLLRGTIQTFGNYSLASIQKVVDESFWRSIEERFEIDPDPGVHASCEWLMRRFGRTSLRQISNRMKEHRLQRGNWFVNSNGHVMAIVQGPIEYMAGADNKDPDREAGRDIDPVDGFIETWSEDDRHRKIIPRSLAVALKETNLTQINEFDDHFHTLHNKSLGPTMDHPACRVSWNKAAQYCNWLSKKEEIPEQEWCFFPIERDAAIVEMQLAPNYLHRTGYRLPTEAEWEYFCRAGTVTRRFFGETDELLNQYTWNLLNSREKILSIPGHLKPNELGLFDTLGNVSEWCLDEFNVRTPGMRRKEHDIEGPLDSSLNRIMRGGSIYSLAEDLRASEYANFAKSYREGNTGFRIVRTMK